MTEKTLGYGSTSAALPPRTILRSGENESESPKERNCFFLALPPEECAAATVKLADDNVQEWLRQSRRLAGLRWSERVVILPT
jgi:hypothetical protein